MYVSINNFVIANMLALATNDFMNDYIYSTCYTKFANVKNMRFYFAECIILEYMLNQVTANKTVYFYEKSHLLTKITSHICTT